MDGGVGKGVWQMGCCMALRPQGDDAHLQSTAVTGVVLMSGGRRGVLEHVVGAATAGIGLVGPGITIGGSCLTAWCRTVRPQCCTCQLSCVSVGRTHYCCSVPVILAM